MPTTRRAAAAASAGARPSQSPAKKPSSSGSSRVSADQLPFGRSIFPAVVDAGGGSRLVAYSAVLCTALALLALLWLPTLLATLDHGDWDASHSVSLSGRWHALLPTLLREATGLTDGQVGSATALTLGAFGLLFVTDILSEFCPATLRWPTAWRCDTRECYLEMFCEPTREGCLVRRPGNCYSNVLYMFSGVVVLLSVWQRPSSMAVADGMFGVMLLVLALLSVIWHASNAPKSQCVLLFPYVNTAE
jgi:type IV secretory pathway TrbD component